MKILITAELSEAALDRLHAAGHELHVDTTWALQRQVLSEEATIRLAEGCEIIIAEMEPVSRQVMDAAGPLRLIASARDNPVNVDLTTATARAIGFSVAYVPVQTPRRAGKSHLRPLRDGVRFLLIIIKIGTLYSPQRLFLPVSAAFFLTGLAYYAFTYIEFGRFTTYERSDVHLCNSYFSHRNCV